MDKVSDKYLDCLCRTCMNELVEEPRHQWKSIYDAIYECEALRIDELLSNTIPQMEIMQPNDPLPNKICCECVQHLLNASRFQKMCLQSQQQLRELIAKRNALLKMTTTTTEGPAFLKQEPIFEATYDDNGFQPLDTTPELIQQHVSNSITLTNAPLEAGIKAEFIKQEAQSEFELLEAQNSGSLPNLSLHGDVSEFIKNEPCDDNETNIVYGNRACVANEPCDDDNSSVGNSDDGTMYSTDSVEDKVLIVETGEEQVSIGTCTHKCHLCNKSFTQLRYLARHLQRHKKWQEKNQITASHNPAKKRVPENFCELCKHRFRTPSLLKKHIMEMHDTNPPQETVPVPNIHKVACNLCDKRCPSLSALKKHKTMKHPGEKQEKTVYSCEFCDKVFKWPFELRSHVQNKHIKGRSHPCTICGKAFNTTSRLKLHLKRHSDDKPFECPYCPQRFRCSSDVIKHKKDMHKGIKPHLCDICGASFSTTDLLNKHRVLHSGIKPFKCDYCEKWFAREENRRIHMRVHTGEKPYKCKYCERPYAQLSDLTYHLRVHLGDNVYRCELCPLAFPLASEKRLHLVTHENEDPATRERNLQALKEEDDKLKLKAATNDV